MGCYIPTEGGESAAYESNIAFLIQQTQEQSLELPLKYELFGKNILSVNLWDIQSQESDTLSKTNSISLNITKFVTKENDATS